VIWDTKTVRSRFCASFVEVLQATRTCSKIAVDMPIGLPRRGEKRACDQQARQLLGKQASSIFPAPPREALAATTFEELKGWGLSLQSFYLFGKIREIEAAITPPLQVRIHEAHPELAFRTRANSPLEKKKTPSGKQQRRQLLPFEPGPLPGVGVDDLLDASILAVVARALDEGTARRCYGGLDTRGLTMEICF